MVGKLAMEEAAQRIARATHRTCGELVRYRRKSPPHKGEIDYKPREGTILLGSLGSNRYEVGIADKQGLIGSRIMSGTSREIYDAAWNIAAGCHAVSKPPMEKMKSSRHGTPWGQRRFTKKRRKPLRR